MPVSPAPEPVKEVGVDPAVDIERVRQRIVGADADIALHDQAVRRRGGGSGIAGADRRRAVYVKLVQRRLAGAHHQAGRRPVADHRAADVEHDAGRRADRDRIARTVVHAVVGAVAARRHAPVGADRDRGVGAGRNAGGVQLRRGHAVVDDIRAGYQVPRSKAPVLR